MSSTTVNAKVNDLLALLMKVGWKDLFQSHFTLANSGFVNTDLVDWLIRGEIDDFCPETDDRYLAWTAVQRESGLNTLLHFLRQSDGDVNFADDKGQTLLHVFLRDGLDDLPRKASTKVVKTLLRLGASVDAVDADDDTPMHVAAVAMQKSLMRLMLPSFTNVHAASGFNADAVLHDVVFACDKDVAACEDQYTEIVRALVAKGADPSVANESGITAVQLAAEYNFYEMLRIFRDSGADLRDATLLHLACAKDKNSTSQLKIIELLVSEGCDVNARDGSGETPLHRAARLRCAKVVERLVQLGGDVNSRTKNLNVTPLHLAAAFNQPSNVEILLRAGADVDAEDGNGLTPLHIAASRDGVKAVKSLINRGADVNRRERTFGFTPLHVAAAGCKKTVELLLRRGAKVNAKSEYDVTPLHLAALAGNAKVARVLIERGADVNCRGGGSKLTAMHMTAMWDNSGEVRSSIFKGEDLMDRRFHGMFRWVSSLTMERDNVAVAEVLVMSGGDVNAKDATGRTPLHLATLRTASDMVEPILRLGAHVDEVDDEGRSPARNVLISGGTKGLKCLLKFGLNVNDDDVRIDNGESKTVGYLIGYVTKMKMLGLTVRDDYDCAKCEEVEQRFVELEMMKSRVVDGSEVTVHEVLHMKARRRAIFGKKVMSMDLEDEFPEFFEVIEASCKRAVNRAKLLGPAVEGLRKVTGIWWPEICVERILSCLSDRYLRKLVASAEVNV